MRITITNGALAVPAVCWVLGWQRFGWSESFTAGLMLMLTLVLHEAGHIAVARLYGVRVKSLGVRLSGPFIQRERATPLVDAMISVAGPLANLLVAAIFWKSSPVLHWLAQMNLIVAVSNLAPLSRTDGSNALASVRQWHRIRIAQRAGGYLQVTGERA